MKKEHNHQKSNIEQIINDLNVVGRIEKNRNTFKRFSYKRFWEESEKEKYKLK